jgi:pimeloyl-ACP methyl ester carboxylesterase
MAPTLFVVPGVWEGPGSFDPLKEALAAAGHGSVFVTSLVSTGRDSKSTPIPNMDDDVAAITADLARVVEEAGPDGVVALLHSAGGMLGSAAMKGLTAKARQEEGKTGGVRKIVFLAAGIGQEGVPHKDPPFFEVDVSPPV